MLAYQYQLNESQYLDHEILLNKQFSQINEIFKHALKTVPFYRKLKAVPLGKRKKITPDKWHRVPVLTRSEVQENFENLQSTRVPDLHGSTNIVQTSGSTGTPVKVTGTELTAFLINMFALRDHIWHRRDLSAKSVAIRFSNDKQAQFPGVKLPNWGPPMEDLVSTGPTILLASNTDIALQAELLIKEEPHYLLSYPSNLEALARYFIDNDLRLKKLHEVRSLGEYVGSRVRPACKKAWGLTLVDMYTAQEVGYIATQCPQQENNYHVQAENLYVEVVDDDGQPCKPGETGRVLLTTLHNFAMPLIRYEIGDYARVGELCSCGRTLPVLTQIVGRRRNMIFMPNGEKSWPTLNISVMANELSIKQFQIVQKNLSLVEARIVPGRPLTPDEESYLITTFQEKLKHPFNIDIKYTDNIPRSKGGKFEDFISEVA